MSQHLHEGARGGTAVGHRDVQGQLVGHQYASVGAGACRDGMGKQAQGMGATLDGLWGVGHRWAQLSAWANGMQRAGGTYHGQVEYRSQVVCRGWVHGEMGLIETSKFH